MIAATSFGIILLGDFFKSVNFSQNSFVISGCRWGKISYLKILPNHFPCICLNAWGDFSYFSFFPQLQFIFLIGIGYFFQNSKISPNMVKYGIYGYLQAMPHSQPFGLFHGRLAPYKTAKTNAPVLLTSHAPFAPLRGASWTAGAV